jgi:L-lactate utilization protein LutC
MSDVEVAYTNTANAAQTQVVYVRAETRAEKYKRWSNQHADRAAELMAAGADEMAIEMHASSADTCAALAVALRFLELALEQFP